MERFQLRLLFNYLLFEITKMTHERKTEVFKELFDSCYNLQIDKAKDYASDSDALSNFKGQDAEALGLTPYQKWGVYFGKQAMSIMNAIGKNPNMPSTTSEPIEERIHDAIIYLVLLKCLLEDSATNQHMHKRPSDDKRPHSKVSITRNDGESSYNFTFTETMNIKLNEDIFIYNESDPYVQYKFLPIQIITNNTYECILVEKRSWGAINSSSMSIEWFYEECSNIDLNSGYSYFITQQ